MPASTSGIPTRDGGSLPTSNSYPLQGPAQLNPAHHPSGSYQLPNAERERASDAIKRGLGQLDVQLPDSIMEKVTATYNDMPPLQRFVEETLERKRRD
jgi:hypothetical protein